ncbi:MAG: tetratricopeptide repeat protein [Bacteroidales bacterium]|nr:tetratricopeptide repeat protein [Bacteroidales bacterium]
MEREEKYTILRDLTEQESYTEAMKQVDAFLEQDKQDDMLWYLRGNIFKKQEQWKQAIDSYTEAISINPKNPATTMRRICIDILNFYDKTLYNV